ncbi:MAG: chorismate synthase [Candidatus Omnitrophica bacterium]|nr:chorismate synthase [Candidatus Omnitrophota bacterium]
MLRYLTAGESHGASLVAVLEGMPAGLKIAKERIDRELKRRMQGYGRGDRMRIESDKATILSGLRKDETIGSPITLIIENRDSSIANLQQVLGPRPGHADLAGGQKYDRADLRDILERSSARETAARVGVGAICKTFLSEFDIDILSHVVVLGGIEAHTRNLTFSQIRKDASGSDLNCADKAAAKLMRAGIDKARKSGDTLGGIFEIIATGLPPGLGSHVQHDRKLDAGLAAALMSIQSAKGVEIGAGFKAAIRHGSRVHDEIFYLKSKGFFRKTNNAGGIEGGISNGEPITIRVAVKPISTLRNPLKSVNIKTKQTQKASVERSDVCVVPAAGVVGEAVTAIELAGAMLEKFGGDSIKETLRNYNGYLKQLKSY